MHVSSPMDQTSLGIATRKKRDAGKRPARQAPSVEHYHMLGTDLSVDQQQGGSAAKRYESVALGPSWPNRSNRLLTQV